jgi:hypothetical protein
LASHRERCLLRTLAAGRRLRRLHAAAQHAGFNAPRLFINCQITSVTSGRQAPEILDLFPAAGGRLRWFMINLPRPQAPWFMICFFHKKHRQTQAVSSIKKTRKSQTSPNYWLGAT